MQHPVIANVTHREMSAIYYYWMPLLVALLAAVYCQSSPPLPGEQDHPRRSYGELDTAGHEYVPVASQPISRP